MMFYLLEGQLGQLEALLSFGRPKKIELLVFVDRRFCEVAYSSGLCRSRSGYFRK